MARWSVSSAPSASSSWPRWRPTNWPASPTSTSVSTWLESEYHRSPHRGLKGATPLETWLAKCHLIVALDPAVDLAEAFCHQAHPQGPPRLHRHPRRRPVRAAFHPDRRTGRAASCRRPTAAWSTPTPTLACAAPTCASIPPATMSRTPPPPRWHAPIRLTIRCRPPPPRWPPRGSRCVRTLTAPRSNPDE